MACQPMSSAELLVSGFGKVVMTCYTITHFDLELYVLFQVLVTMRDVPLHLGLEAIAIYGLSLSRSPDAWATG